MARKDKVLALFVFRKIKPSQYTMKVFRGLLRFVNPFT